MAQQAPKGTQMLLRVWGFSNPVDLNPLTGFVLKTMDGSGGLIEVSKPLQLRVTHPSIIQDAQASFDGGSP